MSTRMKKPFVIPQCDQCMSKKFSVFEVLNTEDLGKLSDSKGCNYYRKGQTIFFEGNNSNGVYCVHKGKIKLHKLGLDGKEQIIRFAKDGDIMGYRALLSGETYSLSATVLEDSSICYIPKESLIGAVLQDPKFSLKIMELTCKEMGKATDTITNLAQKPVRERLAEVILILKETFGERADGSIDVVLTREEIASLVGTATESCIRLLSEFKRDELIKLEGKKITILNRAKLMKEGNLFE
jgi:CRP/FNR family transcriptional regulator